VNASSDPPPPESRTSIRMDARLDALTRAWVDEFAQRFHQPRAAAVCAITRRGLSRGPAARRAGGVSARHVRHLSLSVSSERHQRVQQATTVAGMHIAPWRRAMVRQITRTDFPASWQEARSEERSHDSRTDGTRVMRRLDDTAQTKLRQLMQPFGASNAPVIRQSIAQATPEDVPNRWHMTAVERPARVMRQDTRDHRELTR
jgi:hypothetical protein